jgi:hypothetical protein
MTDGHAEVLLDPGSGRVRVRDRRLTVDTEAHLFVGRALACPAVTGVDCDVRTGRATVDLDAAGPGFAGAVVELSHAIRSGSPVRLPMDAIVSRQFTLRRVGRRLTTWKIGSDAPDQLRFRHPRLRRDRVLTRRLERLVVMLPGVHDVRLSGWKSDLVVHVDTRACDGDALLGLLQRAVDERATAEAGPSAWQMAGKSGTLALLAATDLVLPALAPVSALLLVGSNLRTIGAAAGDVKRLRLGPAVVATAIICGTLATGQFLAAGIMAWSFEFWRRRHHRDIEAERTILLEDAVPMSPRLIEAEGSQDPVVMPGQRLGFSPWDVLASDGVVVSGGGVVDERCLTGVPGGRAVRVGDRVAAGSVVLGGTGVMAVEHRTEESRVASVVRLLASATELKPGLFTPTVEGDKLVSQFAGPTLATAGLGFLAGDVTTAVAVLRPDYGSAEAMSLSFEDLDAVACGLSAGCLLTAPRVLDRLHAVDTLLVLAHPGLREPELEVTRVVSSCRDKATEGELVRLAASLARHLADARRGALARMACDRGCFLSDYVPDSFGDEKGLRIVCHRGETRMALGEGPALANATRPLVLEINGTARATFEFGPGLKSRAACALEQIQECRPLRVIVAGSPEMTGDLPCSERVMNDRSSVRSLLASLRSSGRKVAVVGLPSAVMEFEGAAEVTISLGLSTDPSVPVAAVICLPGCLESLSELLAAAADRRGRLATSRRLSILPNAACVAGAFLFGFTSVIAAVVTNLGTLGIYRRVSGGLRRRRRLHWLRQRAMFPRLARRFPQHDLPKAS